MKPEKIEAERILNIKVKTENGGVVPIWVGIEQGHRIKGGGYNVLVDLISRTIRSKDRRIQSLESDVRILRKPRKDILEC